MQTINRKILSLPQFVISLLLCASCTSGLFRNYDEEGEKLFLGMAPESLKKPYSIPEGSKVIKNLSYGEDPQQKLDIFLPKKDLLSKDAPVVFMVHGGAWMLGDKTYHPVVANKIYRWLPKGIIFVSINYRMSFSPNPLNQVDDVARALNFITTNAKNYHIDPNKIMLMGHSAGAHLVSLLSSNKKFILNYPNIKWIGTVSLDSAAFDLVETMSARHYRIYDRVFGQDKENWIKNSPTWQINQKIAPMLIVCSNKRSDSCPQAEAFAKKANIFNSDVIVMPVPLKHGEVNTNLGVEDKYTSEVENFMKKISFFQ